MSTPEVTDGALIERVATRDREAFEELYAPLRPPGARTRAAPPRRPRPCRGLGAGGVRRSLALGPTYDRARGPGGAWLYTIARNAIVDALRRRPAPTVAEPPDVVSTSPTPDDEAEASWNTWRVHRALETLPEHERPVIDLAYFSGLSQSEIAEFLQIPLGTVKTRTRSGLARLADALEGDAVSEPTHRRSTSSSRTTDPGARPPADGARPARRRRAAARAATVDSGARRPEPRGDHVACPRAATPRSRRSRSPRLRRCSASGYAIGARDGPKAARPDGGDDRAGGRTASIALHPEDAAGNWPMTLEVSGLPQLPDGETYTLVADPTTASSRSRAARSRSAAGRRRCRSTRRTV